MTTLEGFVSAGYLVARRAIRPAYVDSTAFPDRIVSASDHLAPVLPVVPVGWIEAVDAPPGRFSGFADAAQGNLLWALEADLERFGLDGSRSAELSDWLGVAYARGDFHPPSAFATLEAARRFVQSFGPLPDDALIIGLALRREDVSRVAEADAGVTYVSRLPTWGREPAAGGKLLGFDVYAPDDGDLRPWVRRPGAVTRLASGGLRANGHGLFESLDRAVAASAEMVVDEPGWFAWRLTAYPLAA